MKVQRRAAAIVPEIGVPTTRISPHTATRPRITVQSSAIAICISGISVWRLSTAMTQRIRATTTAITTTVTGIATAIGIVIGIVIGITKDIGVVTGIVTDSLADRLNYARQP